MSNLCSNAAPMVLVLTLGAAFLILRSVRNSSTRPNAEDLCCPSLYMSLYNKFRMDSEILKVLREKYIFTPQKAKEEKTDELDLQFPPWKDLMQWDAIQEMLMAFFGDWWPGVFVEVGAVDGKFLSQTWFLEEKLNWTGLLIEPDPRSYQRLLRSGRNATMVPLCVNYVYPSVRKFWLRRMEKDLPEHFEQVLLARTKTYNEILPGDETRGSSRLIPCVPFTYVVRAANISRIDFLAIATGEEDDRKKIADILRSKKLEAETLLIFYPVTTQSKEPYLNIPGYIMDAERSQVYYKFYVKSRYCQLQSETDCVKVKHFLLTKACLAYSCFNNITVRTVSPAYVQQALADMASPLKN